MHVSRFRISNYKSFRDSGEVRLGLGFNVVVGQNNVGKTALTEALSLSLGVQPHRSRVTIPTPTALPDPDCRATVSFSFGSDEFRELAAREVPSPVYVPAAPHGTDPTYLVGPFLDLINGGPTIRVVHHVRAQDSSGAGPSSNLAAHIVGYEPAPNSATYNRFDVDPDSGEFRHVPGNYGIDPSVSDAFFTALTNICTKRLYAFKAVRFGINEHPVGPQRDLSPDASNLVQVLHLLQTSNPYRWERYVESVRTILPQIKALTFAPQSGGSVRLLLWNVDPSTERDDLAVSLSESGTGVGQVLAILYVAFTSEYQRTIVIDEPQSFLHPGAIRKLFDILKGYPQHQYVITTHSPTAVTAADPSTLLMIRKEEEESVVDPVGVSEVRDQDLLLKEVGARLSDVFGADDILWVEGPTEEAGFPLILSKVAKRPLLGTKILGVVQTGDFESKHSDTILEIYRRLSEGRGLLPPAVGFIFDREDRDEAARTDLERRSGGKVVFTGRRMYENYLLDSSAIAAVASGIQGFREGTNIDPEEVSGWLEKHRWDDKYFGKNVEKDSQTEEVWLSDVHGAKLLDDMFQDLSETRVSYDKVVHGTALTRWLCDSSPEDLQDLARLIEDRLDRLVSR